MKEMTRKKHLWIPLTLMLLASIAMVNVPVKASSSVKIYINPEIPDYIPGVAVGEIVDVEVRIESPAGWENTADGIVGWSLYCRVDPDVLNTYDFLGATPGYFLRDFIDTNFYPIKHRPQMLVGDVNASHFMDLAAFIQGYEEIGVGAGGNGTLCTLQFECTSVAWTLVDLFDVYYYTLAGVFQADIVGDGQYETPPNYEANLVGRSAWKEHAHFDRSKHGNESVPDAKGTPGYQTLFAKIKNIGDINVTVKAQFRIYKDIYDETWYTTEAEIEPGQIIVLTFDFAGKDGSPPWDTEDDGIWRIEAKCLYYDAIMEAWQTGTKIKTTKFACVP